MPTRRYDQKLGVFVLSEYGKAITFIPANHVITFHAGDEYRGELPINDPVCEYVGHDAHCDGSFSAGDELLRRWEDSGRFNDVVWDELQRWFERYFPVEAAAR